jgi:phosphopantothenoylcysteine decarboxylase/phosphopantothenate--cysteine ligase
MLPQALVTLLKDRRVLLGVTGSIAAYKSAELASALTQVGAKVDVVLTDAARRFVTPLTFQSVTGRRAYTDEDLWGSEGHVMHVALAQAAHVLVVAPATANTLAKMAHGQSDSLLTILALAAACPTILAPAMDAGMYGHPATQANLEILRSRGAIVVGPAQGRMASGLVGWGRIVEPGELMGHIRQALGLGGPLSGRQVVVTAGGTHEPIDPVRMIVNRSSGKQGFALAQAAIDRGAEVVLITGPTHLEAPVGAKRVDVGTAEQMRQQVVEAAAQADVLLMAAAVADYRPATRAAHKIKKSEAPLILNLEPTDDILIQVTKQRKRSGRPQVVVGFAAESQDVLEGARTKLYAKGLSLIVANDITSDDSGFGVDTNRVTLLDSDGTLQELPLMSKAEVADVVLARVVALLEGSEGRLSS